MLRFLLVPLSLIPLFFNFMTTTGTSSGTVDASPGWDPNGHTANSATTDIGPGWDPDGGVSIPAGYADGDARPGWDPNG